MKRHIYFKMKTLEEAKELFFKRFVFSNFLKSEDIGVRESLGRVTVEPIFAKVSSPSFHSASMDGIAVLAEKTYGAKENSPKRLTINKDAFFINTGEALPPKTDSVIMIEDINRISENTVEIYKSSYPWQNVRKVGEDIVASELILPQNHIIRPFDIGALLSSGIFFVPVKEKPKVAIIPTGSELSYNIEEGKVIESNSAVVSNLIKEIGGEPIVFDIVPDEYEKIKDNISKAVNMGSHMVIINAGSSSGSKDYTASVISELGEVLVHGITIMPGKPTILGEIKGIPVIGNPGYPVASVISFNEIIKPILCMMLGIKVPEPKKIMAIPSQKIPSKVGMEEFIRVGLGKVNDKFVAILLPRKSAAITSLTKACGIIRIKNLIEGIDEDEEVEVELLSEISEILNTIVIIGSHDNTLDILRNEIRKYNLDISSSNVGSLGGIMALKKGKAHVAGSHLFDPETGQYNFPYIRRYLREVPLKVINLVFREQGLIFPKENPKNIKGLEDLIRKDIVFINRQPGSGTRILLDYKLRELGIDSVDIKGYENIEYTHMAVAVNVLSGAADVGLGIYAAAKALNLDFIPICKERYDLIIPEVFYNEGKIQSLIKVICSESFKQKVIKLGGYDVSMTGKVLSS